MADWILASTSPRRKELLARLGHPFRCVSPDVEEWEPRSADPVAQVRHNSRVKCRAIAEQFPASLVIAADTTVALDDQLFAKPVDRADAFAMLSLLNGKTHRVFTGVALSHQGCERFFYDCSEVTFKQLSAEQIYHYIDTVPVMDKAGAYAIQQGNELLIAGYHGSFENIMGLPIQRLAAELVEIGL